MDAVELYHLIHRKPFAPFRIIVQGGRSFGVRLPRLAVVGTTFLNLGIPVADDPDPVLPICEYVEHLPLSAIERVEPLGATTPTA